MYPIGNRSKNREAHIYQGKERNLKIILLFGFFCVFFFVCLFCLKKVIVKVKKKKKKAGGGRLRNAGRWMEGQGRR